MIPREMASDGLWVVSFKCVVKGYQECHFDVKEGEDFKVLKKIGEKGCAFHVISIKHLLLLLQNCHKYLFRLTILL